MLSNSALYCNSISRADTNVYTYSSKMIINEINVATLAYLSRLSLPFLSSAALFT